MTSQKEILSFFPTGVFLDTNILEALPETLESPDLSVITQYLGTAYVPDIVAREWLAHRLADAKQEYEQIIKNEKHLSSYLPGFLKMEASDWPHVEAAVIKTCVLRLKGAGLTIMRPPRFDQREVVRKAVMAVPPFRDRGRGFKDELVILGVEERLRRYRFSSAILVTRDKKDFQDGVLARFSVRVFIVHELSGARQLVEKHIAELEDQNWLANLREQENALLALARENWDSVKVCLLSRIENEGIPEANLFGSELLLAQSSRSTVKRYLQVYPEEISRIAFGLKHPAEPWRVFTVWVRCRVALEIESYCAQDLMFPMVRREEQDWFRLPRDTKREVIEVPCELSVEAKATEDAQGRFTEFTLISMPEYVRLVDQAIDRSAGPLGRVSQRER